ncbi:formyltetrahydrofolate deformylase [Planosporangium flavigriseum]|uniref:Formyltetrahydrofolate deformylase n=1 Tax=Planosporangium flavigriseum TaxID=373681 RepID=A0A8J3LX40_9ACTN|nr:formyltetrahydrofolate deformylase [Planosporangium flavigriseum]NJC66137.1 formyltetrahydrofolate deformylase [Planosporangium flavigriseum]GIG75171.1 formyltetrahydrofolate deformylase [Planosporangium flavigriseum]
MSPVSDYVLTLTCEDRPGIVHSVTGFLVANGCNIVEYQQFGDQDSGHFFMRAHFQRAGVDLDVAALRARFAATTARPDMEWGMYAADDRPRLLIMVSKLGHCLNDLLFRWSIGSLNAEIVGIVSNHPDFADLAASYKLPYYHVPVTPETKPEAEARLLQIVDEHQVDLVVLARYMQVLSSSLCETLAGRAVNIHHSFLPSFAGARPYHQAYTRGVKLIGATAHFVTADLDEGPIIEQEVARVDHTNNPAELTAIGRDVECLALAHAVEAIVERRVLLNGNRTVVFR